MEQGLSAMPAEKQFERPIRNRHLAFCRQVALGMSPALAYKKYCTGHTKRGFANTRTCLEQAHRFQSRWHGYISNLRAQLGVAMDQAAIVAKIELLTSHSLIHRSPADELAKADSPFAKVTTITIEGPEGTTTTTKVEGPDKLENATILAKMAGYNEPEKIEHSVRLETPLIQFIGNSNANELRLNTGNPLPIGDFQRPACAWSTAQDAELIPLDHQDLPADGLGIGRKVVFKSQLD